MWPTFNILSLSERCGGDGCPPSGDRSGCPGVPGPLLSLQRRRERRCLGGERSGDTRAKRVLPHWAVGVGGGETDPEPVVIAGGGAARRALLRVALLRPPPAICNSVDERQGRKPPRNQQRGSAAKGRERERTGCCTRRPQTGHRPCSAACRSAGPESASLGRQRVGSDACSGAAGGREWERMGWGEGGGEDLG